MKLAEIILANERNNESDKNNQLVRIRLKELVYGFSKEVFQVLHRSGVAVSSLLPSPVLYAVVVKNLPINSELRETIAKMLLELDGYDSADGSGWQLIGGSLSAIGSVLAGIGRSQVQSTQDKSALSSQEKADLEQEIKDQKSKSNRTLLILGGILGVALIGLVLYIALKKKPAAGTNQQFKTQTT